MAKTAQLVVLVPQDVKDQISSLAADRGVTQSVIVREALNHGLARLEEGVDVHEDEAAKVNAHTFRDRVMALDEKMSGESIPDDDETPSPDEPPLRRQIQLDAIKARRRLRE